MTTSIALCTYNGEAFLREQLESYAAQTQPVSELVACDDRSTDRTLSILRGFAASAPFPVLIEQNAQQLGGARNFEKALSLCTGDLIFFSDQDDVWRPEKVEVGVRFAIGNPDRLGFFSNAALLQDNRILDETLWDMMDFTPERIAQTGFDDLLDYFFTCQFITYGSTLAVRRDALPEILPFRRTNERMWHDEWIALVLSLKNRYAYINEPLINYRLHAGQEVGLRWVTDPFVASQKALYDSLRHSNAAPDAARLQMLQAWNAYQKTGWYDSLELPEIARLKDKYRDRFHAARKEFLTRLSFPGRKARLMKWYLNGRYETTLGDALRL